MAVLAGSRAALSGVAGRLRRVSRGLAGHRRGGQAVRPGPRAGGVERAGCSR
ncbi:hypothetical protein ACFYUK_19310 [Nonomuraea wenchangensis]